jgi:Pentapeptide repeats (8 copies)
MANPEHVELVKQGAEAIRKWREENPETRLDLVEADLHGDDLAGAHLNRANLHRANLNGADLHGADLTEAELVEALLRGADLRRAEMEEAHLHGANLERANLAGAFLRFAYLDEALLRGANLRRAVLLAADLHGANLATARLHGARLDEANLDGANLHRVHGAYQADDLETTRLGEGDVLYFEKCNRRWPERWFDWERLRVMGRLPLFGISYTTLILIPFVFYGLALYNDKVELVRAWAEQVIALPSHPWDRLAPLVLERLHPRPIPSQSLLLLVSTILLAAGSTLYTFFCPSRVKEFSRDQWCDQLGRSLLHYWPLAWKYRYIRLASAASYALGGAGALWVLSTKVWYTALFILKHSTFPWSWR